MMYLILIFVLLCFLLCHYVLIFLFKSDRENEEHVYEELLAVRSSNEQISGSLREKLCCFVNDSCFCDSCQTYSVFPHFFYQTKAMLVSKAYCLSSPGFLAFFIWDGTTLSRYICVFE